MNEKLKMHKRKNVNVETVFKRQKIEDEKEEDENHWNIPKSNKLPKKKIPWPDHDITRLLERIQEVIPANDNLPYHIRVDKINWEDVIFESYTIEQCREVWHILQRQIRKYRSLNEIVADIKGLVQEPTTFQEVRHPEKPKYPASSFILFVNDKRSEFMKEHPGMSQKDISLKLTEMFKQLSPKKRLKYTNQAQAARAKYKEEMSRFYEEHPEMIPKKVKKGSKEVEFGPNHGPPLKPKTPFELFVENETKSDQSVTISKCRELWEAKPDSEKFTWIQRAEKQHMKYTDDLKQYLKEHPNYEPSPCKSLTKREQKIKEQMSGKPDKPPRSSYHLFWKMLIDTPEMLTLPSQERLSYISEKWKNCQEEEKAEYQIRVQQMWETYNQQMDKYIMTLSPEERDRVTNEMTPKKRKRERKKVKTPQREPGVKIEIPEMPPLTPYKCFFKSFKGKRNPHEVWKQMSDEKKRLFEEKWADLKRKYIVSYEEYLRSLTKHDLQKLAALDQYISESDSD